MRAIVHALRATERVPADAPPGRAAALRITLPPFETVTGTVTYEDGRPVTGARVMPAAGYQSAVTDDKGRFTIPFVPAGPHRLMTISPHGGYLEEKNIEVGGGGEGGGAAVELKVPTPNVTGRVLAADGKPAAGLSVSLHARDMGPGKYRDTRSTQTGPDGSFALSQFKAGEYHLSVGGRPSRPGIRARRPLDVPADGVTRADVKLPPTGSVGGTVTGPDGRPIAGVSATAVAVGPAGSGGAFAADGKTGADGKFVIEDVPVGRYRVQVSAGRARAKSDEAAVEEGRRTAVDVVLPNPK